MCSTATVFYLAAYTYCPGPNRHSQDCRPTLIEALRTSGSSRMSMKTCKAGVAKHKLPDRLPSRTMISAGKCTHRLSLLSDCEISILDEHEVHEHVPNFRIFKVVAPSVFSLSPGAAAKQTRSPSTPCRS